MVREGIYIGGKEILERYVGNKLVWKKIKEVEVVRFVETNEYSGAFYWFARKDKKTIDINLESIHFATASYTNVYIVRNNEKFYPTKVDVVNENSQTSIFLVFENNQERIRFYNAIQYNKGSQVSIIARK